MAGRSAAWAVAKASGDAEPPTRHRIRHGQEQEDPTQDLDQLLGWGSPQARGYRDENGRPFCPQSLLRLASAVLSEISDD